MSTATEKDWCSLSLALTLPLLFSLAGSRGDGQQRHITISAGDRENQEPVVPQPNAGHEHREEAEPRKQE